MTSISLIDDKITVLDKTDLHVNKHQQPHSHKKFNEQSSASLIFNYTGAEQTFVIPSGVTFLDVLIWGAGGGSYRTKSAYAGYGLLLSTNIPVTPGTTCYLYVGGQGMGYDLPGTTPFNGGFNGGGNGNSNYGYAGGGASDIRIGGSALTNRVAVAGGGIICNVILIAFPM